MSVDAAKTRYTQAKAAQVLAHQQVTQAEKALEKASQRVEAAEQAYLDALGAPAMGTLLPFDGRRVLDVSERALQVGHKAKGPGWRVGGYLREAREGTWVKVQRFAHQNLVGLKSRNLAQATEWQAHAQSLLEASEQRSQRVTGQPLRLGRNEQALLEHVKFVDGVTAFVPPRGILFGGSTLTSNLRIVENLRRKGVLTVPAYEPPSGGGTIPDWYFRKVLEGPRATEARAVLASARVIAAMKRAGRAR